MNSLAAKIAKAILPDSVVGQVKNTRRSIRQKKRFSINNGEDVLKEVTIFGKTLYIYLNPYLNGGVDDDIYKTGTWEPEILAIIKKYIPKNGVFIDIGANIGFHSLAAAVAVGKEGKVVSFEPIPRLRDQMLRSVKKNDFANISVEPFALGLDEKEAVLSIVDENIGASSLQNVDVDREVNNKVVVSVKQLDSYMDHFSHIDLIKIDIEGSEFEALRGGEELIKKFKPVIVLEFSPHIYEKDYMGKSLELFTYLSNLGYKITDVENRVTDIEAEITTGDFAQLHINLLCVPAEAQ